MNVYLQKVALKLIDGKFYKNLLKRFFHLIFNVYHVLLINMNEIFFTIEK